MQMHSQFGIWILGSLTFKVSDRCLLGIYLSPEGGDYLRRNNICKLLHCIMAPCLQAYPCMSQ